MSELLKVVIPVHVKMRGEVRAILRDKNYNKLEDTGWTPNLVTDYGMLAMGQSGNWSRYTHIGVGTLPPDVSNTALNLWVASSTAEIEVTLSNTGPPDYEIVSTLGRRFEPWQGEGDISEMGIGAGSANGAMSIHTLLTPITKTDQQALDVFHRMTLTPNISDVVGTVNIAGDVYDYTLRPAYILNAQSGHAQYGWTGGFAYDAPISADIESGPTGATAADDNDAEFDFEEGANKGWTFWGLEKANFTLPGGVRSVFIRNRWASGGDTGVQIEFSRQSDGAGIQKTNQHTLAVVTQLVWSR